MSPGSAHAFLLPPPSSLSSHPSPCLSFPLLPASSPPSRRPYPSVRAVSAPEECNEEDCAPQKEVGKVSMEWVAEEKTKVTGTFPPLAKKKWTGYVEKDTAGQTNIYSVEPAIYVSENAISSGTAGDSTEGSEQTIAVSVGLFLGLILAVGIVLQNVGNGTPGGSEVAYTGPSLSFYIEKFKPSTMTVEASVPEVATPVEATLSFSATDSSEVSLEPSDAATQVADEAAP